MSQQRYQVASLQQIIEMLVLLNYKRQTFVLYLIQLISVLKSLNDFNSCVLHYFYSYNWYNRRRRIEK